MTIFFSIKKKINTYLYCSTGKTNNVSNCLKGPASIEWAVVIIIIIIIMWYDIFDQRFIYYPIINEFYNCKADILFDCDI